MDPLITVDDLGRALGAPDLVVLDIRSGPNAAAEFDEGHVPGAVHADYGTAGWRAARGGAPGLLPDADDLARLLGRLGVAPASRVVVVSAGDLATAARVYWTLKTAGHPAVSVLDGGYAAWIAEGRPTEPGPSRARSASDYPVRLDESWRASRTEVARAIAARGVGPALVDARGASDFRGETKSPSALRPGRLPGAVHLDSLGMADPSTRRVRTLPELAALAAPAGDGPAITYCNTGQAAAADWFVLSELLGRPEIRLYDGSMSDWTQDPSRPVETGG